jgi:alpha-tubulin suppressor-like RCC1 family protein
MSFARAFARLALSGSVLTATACRDDAALPSELVESGPAAATAPAPPVFRSISAGANHTCGVTTSSRAYCWGSNFLGQLGSPGLDSPLPREVAGGLSWRNLSAGLDYTCGVTNDNRAFCWGYNGYGKLGGGTPIAGGQVVPTLVAGSHSWRLVRAGVDHTCGITTKNVAYCWGNNDHYQLGDGTRWRHSSPVRVQHDLQWRWISPGQRHTCGVTTDSKAWCIGDNNSGQIGDSTSISVRKTLVQVSGERAWAHVEAGYVHTCGVTQDQMAYCWGPDNSGELGDGGNINARSWPIPVSGGLKFTQIVAAEFYTCGVTTDARGYCWGSGPRGELGNGTTGIQKVPTPLGVPPTLGQPLALTQISSGDSHGCGVTTGGKGYCWGENRYGAIGDGSQGAQLIRVLPSPVTAPAN